MKLTFNGVAIATEPDFLGTDAIDDFQPIATQEVDWAPYTRAEYQVPFARGLRKVTLTGAIRPAPSPTLAARLLAMESLFGSLPDTGDLAKQVGTQIITYPGAVLQSFRAIKNLMGISYGFELTFAVGLPVATSSEHPLISQAETPIESQAGQPITSQS